MAKVVQAVRLATYFLACTTTSPFSSRSFAIAHPTNSFANRFVLLLAKKEILKSVDSLLYVDTDVLFLSDLADVWQHFAHFNESQIAALAPEHEEPNMGWYNRFARHPYYGRLGLNSGVMLMNLTRMRDIHFVSNMLPIYNEYKYNITWGDQCLLNIFFHFHPGRREIDKHQTMFRKSLFATFVSFIKTNCTSTTVRGTTGPTIACTARIAR